MPNSYKLNAHGAYTHTIYDEMPRFIRMEPRQYLSTLPVLSSRKGVKVCILDTGVVDHKSLKHCSHMCNLGRSKHSRDVEGHSHVVAGLISANDSGNLIGLAPDVVLYFAKVTDDSGHANADAIAAGLLWASVNGCQIAVLPHDISKQHQAIEVAIPKAAESHVVVVTETTGRFGDDVLAADTIQMNLPDEFVISTYLDNRYVSVRADLFRSALVAALACHVVDIDNPPSIKRRVDIVRAKLSD